jgi:hypothetical protein
MEPEWTRKIPSSSICNFFYAFFHDITCRLMLFFKITCDGQGRVQNFNICDEILSIYLFKRNFKLSKPSI